VPTGPRIFKAAASMSIPAVSWPSMAVIQSPVWIPAASAGLPSIGSITVRRLSFLGSVSR